MTRAAIAVCSMFCVVGAAASPVQAQVRTAIVSVAVEGDLDPAVEGEIAATVGAALRSSGVDVLMPEEVGARLAEAGIAAPCAIETCGPEIGRAASADALVRARLSQMAQLYTVSVDMFLARDGSVLAQESSACDVCTWNEALETLGRLASGLRATLPGTLTVTVTPPGATATVDGSPVQAGQPTALRPGQHQIGASLEGHVPQGREVSVVGATATAVSIDLVRQAAVTAGVPPAGVTRTPPRRRPFGAWAWVTAGVAVATLASGVAWLAMDGACAIGSDYRGDICIEVYDTWRQGLALTVVGAALASIPITLFVLDHRQRRATAPAAALVLRPVAGGTGVALAGAF